jgi:hydrogenase expression/formation protein HypC
VRIGDYVLVHAGFAIAVIDETEALATLAYLSEAEPEELS